MQFIATVYAQSDLSALSRGTGTTSKRLLSSLMELQNQSNTNESLLVMKVSDSTRADGQTLLRSNLRQMSVGIILIQVMAY